MTRFSEELEGVELDFETVIRPMFANPVESL